MVEFAVFIGKLLFHFLTKFLERSLSKSNNDTNWRRGLAKVAREIEVINQELTLPRNMDIELGLSRRSIVSPIINDRENGLITTTTESQNGFNAGKTNGQY